MNNFVVYCIEKKLLNSPHILFDSSFITDFTYKLLCAFIIVIGAIRVAWHKSRGVVGVRYFIEHQINFRFRVRVLCNTGPRYVRVACSRDFPGGEKSFY